MNADSSPPSDDRPERARVRESRHVHRFNHDEDAADYDQDVLREEDPIRAGYDDLLEWVAEQLRGCPEGPILELGSGTGNLTLRLPSQAELVCVDVSLEMTRRLQAKLETNADRVHFEIDDVLAYVRRAPASTFGAVVSTYTLHHLEEDEKADLFEELRRILRPGGLFVVGDLMFENARVRRQRVARERSSGRDELANTIEDEYFWEMDRSFEALRNVGFDVSTPLAFSDLSWSFVAQLPAHPGQGPRVSPG